jgi:hypothetical protein
MFNDDDLFPSKYYNNTTFPVPTGHVIEICAAVIEDVKDLMTGALRPKVVIGFTGLPKGFILIRTNYMMLASAFGRDGAHWIGRKVSVQRVPVTMNGTTSMGVRFVPIESA